MLKELGEVSGASGDRKEHNPVRGNELPSFQEGSTGALSIALLMPHRLPLVPSKYSMTVMVFIMMLSFYYFSRHVSACTPSSPLSQPTRASWEAVPESENPSSYGMLDPFTQHGM